MPPGWPDLRCNLITVPSCDAHNNRYSRDDETAAYAVLYHENSNDVALKQFASKTLRAYTKNPGLAPRVVIDLRPATKPDGTQGHVARLDAALLSRVMERVARGLHVHDFKRRWIASLTLVADGMVQHDLSPSLHDEAIAGFKTAMAGLPRRGENPQVFWYQWFEFTGSDEKILRMVFYGGLGYFAVPTSSATRSGQKPR